MEDTFIRAEDVAKELDISKAYAYKVIRRLDAELETRDSIREQMERGRLKSENDSLRKENQKLRNVLTAQGIPFGRKQIDRNNK